jgi:hypothetical protein
MVETRFFMSTVCFQLVDDAGQPYRNTDLDSVDVPGDATIIKFRDEVSIVYFKSIYPPELF